MTKFDTDIQQIINAYDSIEYSNLFCRTENLKDVFIIDFNPFVYKDNLILPEKILFNSQYDSSMLIRIDEQAYEPYKEIVKNIYLSEWYYSNIVVGFDKDPNEAFPDLENAYIKFKDEYLYNKQGIIFRKDTSSPVFTPNRNKNKEIIDTEKSVCPPYKCYTLYLSSISVFLDYPIASLRIMDYDEKEPLFISTDKSKLDPRIISIDFRMSDNAVKNILGKGQYFSGKNGQLICINPEFKDYILP